MGLGNSRHLTKTIRAISTVKPSTWKRAILPASLLFLLVSATEASSGKGDAAHLGPLAVSGDASSGTSFRSLIETTSTLEPISDPLAPHQREHRKTPETTLGELYRSASDFAATYGHLLPEEIKISWEFNDLAAQFKRLMENHIKRKPAR